MENYTKYKLKEREELTSLLADKDNLFIVACNKCFKEFETVDEPDCGEFEKIAKECGKNVLGSAKVDFLCNAHHTERKLQEMIPEGTEHIMVVSCGLGVQTVAALSGKPTYAASNSLNYTGHHGMAQEMIPEGTEHIMVVSCGLGVQTVAALSGKPTYAASNSLNYTGHHGMALTKKSCDACAQCYLNITGGICPIVDCSKSLVNGQCGGAKNGKCEVDPQ